MRTSTELEKQESKRRKRALPVHVYGQIERWLRRNKAELVELRSTYTEMAKAFHSETGTEVSDSSIATVLKHLGWRTRPKTPKKSKMDVVDQVVGPMGTLPRLEHEMAGLRHAVRNMTARINRTEAQLELILDRLGISKQTGQRQFPIFDEDRKPANGPVVNGRKGN